VSARIFKLSKGDEIAIKGQHYKVAAQAKLKVIKVEEDVLEKRKAIQTTINLRKLFVELLRLK